MTEIKSDSGGKVVITDEVLSVIAVTSALEAEGIAGLRGNAMEGGKLRRRHLSRGIRVKVTDGLVYVNLAIIVRMGMKLATVSKSVQEKVKSGIETMTGLKVPEVNVVVAQIAGDAKSE